MTNQLNILFMVIGSRVNANGEVPLYCRIMYKQNKKRFMIGCTEPLTIWEQSKQQAKSKSPKAESANQQVKLLVHFRKDQV